MTKQSTPSTPPSQPPGRGFSPVDQAAKAQQVIDKRRTLQPAKDDGPKPIASTVNSSHSNSALRLADGGDFEARKRDAARREEQRRVQKRESRVAEIVRSSGLPARHLANNSAAMSSRGPWREARDATMAAVRDRKNVMLTGKRGPGKTQIATSVAIELAEATLKRVRYLKIAEFFRECREAMRDNQESAALRSLCRVNLLIIDEAHVRGDTDYEDRLLVEVIDRRYDAMLPTVLVTNETREQAAQALGASIVSRFHEVGVVIECNWESYRGRPSR